LDGSQEVAGEFVIASCDAPEIFEPAETALDDVASFIGTPVESVEGHSVRFVGNDRPRAAIDYFGAKAISVIRLVGN
jgi:hypothetical protein